MTVWSHAISSVLNITSRFTVLLKRIILVSLYIGDNELTAIFTIQFNLGKIVYRSPTQAEHQNNKVLTFSHLYSIFSKISILFVF